MVSIRLNRTSYTLLLVPSVKMYSVPDPTRLPPLVNGELPAALLAAAAYKIGIVQQVPVRSPADVAESFLSIRKITKFFVRSFYLSL